MDSQIFTEPPLPDKLWKTSMHCWHFHSLHLHMFINSRGQSIIILGMGWGTIGEGMNTFQRRSCIKLSGDCFNTVV